MVLKRSQRSENKSDKKKLNAIMLVERDHIRKLIVPRENQSSKAAHLSVVEFEKIKNNSQMVPDLNRPRIGDTKTTIEEEIKRQEILKQEIETMKSSHIPDEIDEEKRIENERILAKTEEIKREQEDTVKRCSSLILGVKCKAIQDAQIYEKELIKEGFKQYENSTDHMMEEERKLALQRMQKKREEEWAAKRKHAESILEQIQNNEKQRLEEMQRLQREFKLLKLNAEKYSSEESQNSHRHSALRMELKKQNEHINEQIKRKKQLEREQEKLANIQIQELVKRKLDEEKESERREKKEKQLQERELARLWKIQKNSSSLQQLKDDIMAERIQEQLQRRWREKELETARKRRREVEELKSARDQQIHQKREGQAWITEEKKKEAEKIAEENEKLKNELLYLQHKQKQAMDQHKIALQKQIKEKEWMKKKQHEESLKEREDLLNRIQQQDQMLKETIKRKIDQIRSSNVPTCYIKHLEKHINALS